jgi:type II secretory pathway pseudopilin PulG
MLVVIAIIALLLAVLLPAFGAVRNQARIAATQAQFNALNSGIAAYRAEKELGGGLPPSSSDWPLRQGGGPGDRNKIANPKQDSSQNTVRVAGAHLLVHAMIGAHGLGTPGFRDLDRSGAWSDDTHKGKGGAYEIHESGDKAGQNVVSRYGGAGGAGYVDEKMREKAISLKELYDKGTSLTDPDSLSEVAVDESLFVDAWGFPILYYKANPSALHMTGDAGRNTSKAGVYWQEDNAVITGSEGGALGDVQGMDFGAGADEHGDMHWIHDTKSPDPTAKLEDILDPTGDYEHTFAQYIIDPSIKARPTPVQKNEYLLISAGADGIYGTDDDVTNWTRKKE